VFCLEAQSAESERDQQQADWNAEKRAGKQRMGCPRNKFYLKKNSRDEKQEQQQPGPGCSGKNGRKRYAANK